jgi:hypothetical protein
MRTSLWFVLLLGCGGDGSSTDVPATDGSTPDTADPLPTKRGLVQIGLELPEFNGGTRFLKINGGFVNAPDPRCITSTVGDCVVNDCPQQLGGDYADPGKLTFSPALDGVISFSPGPSFLSFLADVVPWSASESITVTAEGKEVPAFSGTVASPRTLDAGEGRSPFADPISKSQPFTATWVSLPDDVLVVLRQGRDTPAGEFAIIIECKASGNPGRTTIPAAALSRLIPTASGGLSLQVTAHAMRETSVVAGDFDVTLRVLRSFDQTFFHDVN